ncbi:MAG: hypothetical protein NTW67_03845 [Candidatus Woesearchaeota archaeon]|nr:hypothetical protein [Candidatus Woesearchaeota archaeon]
MTIFYHGTTANDAITIAKRGAILSLWDQSIEYLQRLKRQKSDYYDNTINLFLKKYEISDEELIALDLASTGFNLNEIAHRVKCVSLSHQYIHSQNHMKQYSAWNLNSKKEGYSSHEKYH